MKATPVKAKLGYAFIRPSLRQMLRPRHICVKHLGHRLRLSLAHHATIATAAARGGPPAGMSSGEPSATKPRERLASESGFARPTLACPNLSCAATSVAR